MRDLDETGAAGVSQIDRDILPEPPRLLGNGRADAALDLQRAQRELLVRAFGANRKRPESAVSHQFEGRSLDCVQRQIDGAAQADVGDSGDQGKPPQRFFGGGGVLEKIRIR